MLTEQELLDHGIDSTRKANLLKLAEHLRGLDREKFNMNYFYEYYDDLQDRRVTLKPDQLEYQDDPHPCGTVACAVGCGPAAGIPVVESDGDCWEMYSSRVFVQRVVGVNPPHRFLAECTWAFLFSGSWARFDNTPTGAAERIQFVLENGLKGIWDDHVSIYDFFASLSKDTLPYKK